MKNASPRAARMEKALQDRFTPSALHLTDESSRHHGHSGAAPEGETHFHLRMTSAAFSGLGRLARQRLVHEALKDEFEAGLHALTMALRSPEER